MLVVKKPSAEPIPGYRLLEPLGRGGFGEVWKCEAPGGLCKAIKFVHGNLNSLGADSAQAEEELRAIERIKAIRHPFLLSMDRVENLGGELLIVTELADKNLQELFRECQQNGLPGIPRADLLGYLGEAAEVLDLMNEQHGLQHLDVKPRNLFLVSNHVKVADFGLVSSLGPDRTWTRSGMNLGAVTPLYTSPEVFLGKISPRSDQYSLAVAYQELLTGVLPFVGKNSRQLLLLHTTGEPDLQALPQEDRPIVARALAKDPNRRFPSCADFVRALLRVRDAAAAVSSPGSRGGDAAAAETLCDGKADTEPLHVPPGSAPAVLPGYRFLESAGSSPLVDVWKAQRADGQPCLVRLVYGLSGRGNEESVVRFKALHHPVLNSFEVVQNNPGRLVVASALLGNTLRDRWQQCRGQGQPGILRQELLGYLRTVAEALDYLAHQHAIYHLSLNPRNLLLDHGRVQIEEFGLAHLFWVPAGQPVAQRNARYAAPELFDRQVSRTADQYSLALIYQEMLTGAHPFHGQTRQTPSGGRPRAHPELSALPAAERAVIRRALDPDPARRWPSCRELIEALEAGRGVGEVQHDGFVERVRSVSPPLAAAPQIAAVSQDALNQILRELLASAGGATEDGEQGLGSPSGPDDCLSHKFRAGLPVGAARLQLDAFRRQWGGTLAREDEHHVVFQVNVPANFWRQWLGRPQGLEVQVHLSRPHALSATPIDVQVEIRPLNASKKRGGQLLEEVGAPLLENLRTHLLVNSEKRTQDRLLWPYPLRVCSLVADGSLSAPIECRGKDISLSGIGFYLPHEIPTPQVCIHLPNSVHPPYLTVPATLVRAQRCADGWYDVGALFRLTTLRKALSEVVPG
jgi:serine/threonine protein kinase